ncbi:MAG: ATP-binding protein [Candidatus Omnitrophota bacterium]|nr:ATP-binding protein [Candidatus Omnitrophota bacterium]
MIKKKQSKLKLKPRKKLLSGNRVRNGKRVRLKGLVAGLRKDRSCLKHKIQQQTDELKVKNGELKNGAEKQIRSETQIQIDTALILEKDIEIIKQREELLHVTRVGKLAEFVSSLAHEISQPLAAILSYAQAAQRMLLNREPEIQKILSYIVNDDKRATEVIQRLRSLLKKSAPEIKPLDINALINETIMLIATDAAVRSSVIKTELDTNLPLVRGDKIQLQQVLLNLISNSFDALESSQNSREILICTSRKDTDTIIVAVKDSGCGIPAQNMPKLFTHFFTSKPDGLGMGLSISRSIVESHGGRLDAENNPDRGATFYFTLPIDIKDV